jgi:DNA-binding NtrC family response regulator
MNDAWIPHCRTDGKLGRPSGTSTMNNNHQTRRNPTILALSDDRGLIELLLDTCSRPWRVKVTNDVNSYLRNSYLNLESDGDCRVVVVDDEKLMEADRGWLLNKIQNWMPQAFVVYVASNHSEVVEKLARSRGAGYYLSKPLDTERLTNLLDGLQRRGNS